MVGQNYVYHGSSLPDIERFVPKESGHGKKRVYATRSFVIAIIFASPERSSLLADWEVGEESVPYFVERKPGVFEKFFRGRKGYIYLLTADKFYDVEGIGIGSHEVASDLELSPEDVLEIEDLESYLLDLEKKGMFRIFRYSPDLKESKESEILNVASKMVEKFGYEFALKRIRKELPELESKFKSLDFGS